MYKKASLYSKDQGGIRSAEVWPSYSWCGKCYGALCGRGSHTSDCRCDIGALTTQLRIYCVLDQVCEHDATIYLTLFKKLLL